MTSDDLSPRSQVLLRRTFRRHWSGILAVSVIGSAALMVAAFLTIRPEYTASSTIRCNPSPNGLVGPKTDAGSVELFVQTQVHLITSPNVLAGALANPKVAAIKRIARDPKELRKALAVVVIPNTTLIEVSATMPDPNEAAELVNAVVFSYFSTGTERAEGVEKSQIEALEEYDRGLKVQIEELERKWKALESRGEVDLGARQRPNSEGDDRAVMTEDQFKMLGNELFRVRLELIQAEAWANAVRAEAKAAGLVGAKVAADEQEVQRQIEADPDAAGRLATIGALKKKLETSGQGEPARRLVVEKLAETNAEYERIWREKRKQVRIEIEKTSAVVPDGELVEAEKRVRSLKVRQAALRQEAEKAEIASSRAATDAVEVQVIKEMRERLKSMKDATARRLDELDPVRGAGSPTGLPGRGQDPDEAEPRPPARAVRRDPLRRDPPRRRPLRRDRGRGPAGTPDLQGDPLARELSRPSRTGPGGALLRNRFFVRQDLSSRGDLKPAG